MKRASFFKYDKRWNLTLRVPTYYSIKNNLRMQKYLLLSALVSVFLTPNVVGQVNLGTNNHNIEISGNISTYYNQRVFKEGRDNFRKNRFRLRDAQIQIEGRVKNKFKYELQMDFVDLALNSTGIPDPENPGLMDAYIEYTGLGFMNIRAGYGKTPYSRSSLTPFLYSAYWQRAEMLRGDFFSRRDVGVTLSTSLWKQRINIYGGIYTGLGEISLAGDNDPSGRPEYIGRIEIGFPTRYRYREIDDRVSPIPVIMLGLNGRYFDKTLAMGRVMPTFSQGEYFLKVIDGTKWSVGGDVHFQYMGFSAQFESHLMRLEPSKINNQLYLLVPAELRGEHIFAGGMVAQANYFHKPIKTIFSVRYEDFNLNDLVLGTNRRIGGALAYQLDGYRSMIKFQYFRPLEEEPSFDDLNWTQQFRFGWQYIF